MNILGFAQVLTMRASLTLYTLEARVEFQVVTQELLPSIQSMTESHLGLHNLFFMNVGSLPVAVLFTDHSYNYPAVTIILFTI